MIQARIPKNRHEIEVSHDGRPLSVESARIEYEGKRRLLVLVIGDFQLLPDSRCPERRRYETVLAALGDPAKVAALEPACSLLKLNARACNGCPDRPI